MANTPIKNQGKTAETRMIAPRMEDKVVINILKASGVWKFENQKVQK
jgi:hypothetical protein